MGSKSDFLENSLLDHELGGPDYTRPATVYVALYSVAPSDAGGGTEATGAGYARKSVTNNTTNWPPAVAGSKSNGVAITFAAATGNWSAGANQVAFGIFDDPTAGNLLRWGAITTPVPVLLGDTLVFPIGTLVVTED